ncbi:unnamed protein product, partial [Chrysoparadoxa australica]
PAHQNTFAFRHNPNSKKTKAIAAMPIRGLCKKCHEKIEWKKKYRKYKPLTKPGVCQECRQKSVTAAYHVLCKPCAQSLRVCSWCKQRKSIVPSEAAETFEEAKARVEGECKEEGVSLRVRARLLREVEKKFFRGSGEEKEEADDGVDEQAGEDAEEEMDLEAEV